MLVPAILHKEEIIKSFQKYYYTTDMLYETGTMDNWCPDIADCPNENTFQYAVVNKENKLLGYLSYKVDWYAGCAYNFGMISFERGSVVFAKDIFDKLEELVSQLHRVEWRMVSGNPAERGYDNFIKRHNGNKHILKDSIKDKDGNYHNDVIYEIVNGDNK